MNDILKEFDDSNPNDRENCLCGIKGKSRNEKACGLKSCLKCGFDKDEHARRISILKRYGLSERPPYGTKYLNIGARDED